MPSSTTQASSSKKRHASTQPSVEPEVSSKRRKHLRDSQDSDDGEHTSKKDKGKGKEKEVVADKRSEGRKGKRRDKGKNASQKVDDDARVDEASPATLVSSDHEASKHAGEVERLLQKDSPPPQTAPELVDNQNDEIARLRKELATKDDLLSKHQETLTSLQGILSCQICLELMLEPYIITCGHTCCLSCLQAWFRAPPPEENIAPRAKTCPTCRTPVRTRPTPVFIVKNVIASTKAYLEPHDEAAQPIAPGGDVWHGIFPPAVVRNGGHGPGVIEDEEDGVLRCEDCLYEIFDGACVHCGRVFNQLAHEGGYEDDDDDDGDVEVHEPIYHHGGWAPAIWSDGSGDEDEEDPEEFDDFIDDDDQGERERRRDIARVRDFLLPGRRDRGRNGSGSDDSRDSTPPIVRRQREHGPIIISDSEDEDDNDDGIEVPRSASAERRERERQRFERWFAAEGRLGRGRRQRSRSASPGRSPSYESDEESVRAESPPPRRSRLHRHERAGSFLDVDPPSEEDVEHHHLHIHVNVGSEHGYSDEDDEGSINEWRPSFAADSEGARFSDAEDEEGAGYSDVEEYY